MAYLRYRVARRRTFPPPGTEGPFVQLVRCKREAHTYNTPRESILRTYSTNPTFTLTNGKVPPEPVTGAGAATFTWYTVYEDTFEFGPRGWYPLLDERPTGESNPRNGLFRRRSWTSGP